MNAADAIHDFINRAVFAEYGRLERDIGQATLLGAPWAFGRMVIVKIDDLGASLADQVGWMASDLTR